MNLNQPTPNLPLRGASLDSHAALLSDPANTLAQSRSLPEKPSALYRTSLWRAGLAVARVLPNGFCSALSRGIGAAYAQTRPDRREAVIQNLLPLADHDRGAAERLARQLFQQFALKLADLLRYEAGRPVAGLFAELTGWEHFLSAQREKRGVLVVTPHLGNWEFGGPLLTERGFPLQVVTLAEPGNGLTELRRASRARWGIETLVVAAEDPFAFVEIIRRLEAGATVALLVDRPPTSSAVKVELFGRTFHASVAAAELARASGCVVLPVYLPRVGRGYAAHILPAITCDRAQLRDRGARRLFTQEIVRAFEPAIRRHPDQWFHFVPIWPST